MSDTSEKIVQVEMNDLRPSFDYFFAQGLSLHAMSSYINKILILKYVSDSFFNHEFINIDTKIPLLSS